MGFIEELKKKKQEYLEEQQRERLARQEAENANKRLRRKQDWDRGTLVERSKGIFYQSGTAALVEEFLQIAKYEKAGEEFTLNSKLEKIGETFRYQVLIDRQTKHSVFQSTVIDKSIEIEVFTDGTIKFKGGFGGSSVIRKPLWQGNKDLLENALGKAYNHPRVERYPYRPSQHEQVGG